MKTIVVFFVFCLTILTTVTTAFSWEFSMRGEGELRYRYISRTGLNDLFGNVKDVQGMPLASGNGSYNTSIGLAGAQNRFVNVEGYSSKGSDASWAEQRFDIFPTIKVNNAISIRAIISMLHGNLNGSYARLYSPEFNPVAVPNGFAAPADAFKYTTNQSANWATNPHHSGWSMVDSRDIAAGVGMAAPIVMALWYTVNTPWGTLVFGRRPAGFGPGWVLHRDDVYARSLSLVVPYGPFRFIFSQYLHDTGEDSDPNNELNVYDLYWSMVPGRTTWQYTPPGSVDKNKVMDWNQSAAFVYRNGPLDVGALVRIVRWNNVHGSDKIRFLPGDTVRVGSLREDSLAPGPLGGYVNTVGARQSIFVSGGEMIGDIVWPTYGDMFFLLGITYLKYQSDRLFFNGEYDFQYVDVRRQGARPWSGFPQAWMVETGLLAGPMKVSLAHFYRSGHDLRRGGFFIDKWELFLPAWGSGQGPIRHYNFLIGLYGAGNNSFNAAGNCTYTDFLAYAARLDYAVAANLNVFASVMHAERASNTGTPNEGAFKGIYPKEGDYSVVPFLGYAFGNAADNDLGLEIDVGLQWQLLDNLTFNFLFAHWQPGYWFKYAYTDHSRPPTLFGLVSTNPGRVIDPLIGIQSSFVVDF